MSQALYAHMNKKNKNKKKKIMLLCILLQNYTVIARKSLNRKVWRDKNLAGKGNVFI
jgi:hypothetical protein